MLAIVIAENSSSRSRSQTTIARSNAVAASAKWFSKPFPDLAIFAVAMAKRLIELRQIAYLWAFPISDEALVFTKEEGALKDYQFGNKTMFHKASARSPPSLYILPC